MRDVPPAGDAAKPVPATASPPVRETILAITLLLYSSTAFLFLVRPQVEDRPEGDPVVQLVWLPIYAGVIWSLLTKRRPDSARWPIERSLLAFLVLASASVLWSPAPDLTVRRTIALAATVLCGVFLATRFSVLQVLRLFRTTVLIAAAGSILVMVVAPEDARDPLIPSGQALRGAFVSKNLFGRMMVLGLCAELLLLLYARRSALGHAASIVVLGSLLVLSGSATSLLVLVAVATLIVFTRWAKALPEPQLPAGLILIGIAAAVLFVGVFSGYEVVLNVLGRDATLTNRTRIWDAVLQGIRARPVLGYGYGAFWRGNVGPSGIVFRTFGAPIGHAHNGFLEIWAQVGEVGLAVVAVVLVGSFRQAFRHVRGGDPLLGAVGLGFLAFLLLFNIDESALFVQNSIYTILLCYLVTALGSTPALEALPPPPTDLQKSVSSTDRGR